MHKMYDLQVSRTQKCNDNEIIISGLKLAPTLLIHVYTWPR